MWTAECLRSVNADQLPVLNSVIGIGGENEDHLLELAKELEKLDLPTLPAPPNCRSQFRSPLIAGSRCLRDAMTARQLALFRIFR